jgi:hypothetical protein
MLTKTKDILAIIEDVEDKTVDNRINHECFEASTSEALSKIQLAIKEATGNFEQIEEKHNAFVNKVADSIEELNDRVKLLEDKWETIDDWDTQTRRKFAAFENHFEVDLIRRRSDSWTLEEREEEE